MNQAQLVNPNSPVFANSYFDGTYDPTLGTVYRTGDVLSNLLDDYTGEEIQFKKVEDPIGIVADGVIYREKDAEMFKRIYTGGVNVLWFGAKGDGIADDIVAIQKAAQVVYSIRVVTTLGANTTLLFPEGYVFRTTGTLSIPDNINVEMRVRITYDGPTDSPAIIIGTSGVASVSTTLRLNVYCTRGAGWGNENNIGVKLVNQSQSFIYLDRVDGFHLGVECMGDKAGFAYNQVFIKILNSNKIGLSLDFTRSTDPMVRSGWCNENKFYGGRFSTNDIAQGESREGLRIKGDDNIFINPSFEFKWNICSPGYARCATFNDAVNCQILNCRNEGNSSLARNISFAAFVINGSSYANRIEVGYTYIRTHAKLINALQDNSPSKQNEYRSIQNMYAEAELGRLVFDSGNLPEKAVRFNSPNELFISDVLFVSYTTGLISSVSPATETANIINKGNGAYVEIHRNAFSVRLTTNFCKKFAVLRDGLEGRGGNIGVKCYDINGLDITSATEFQLDEPIGDNHVNQTFSYSTNYGGCYLTSGPGVSSLPVYFSVKEVVKTVVLLIGNPTTFTSLRSFKVLSLEAEARNTTAYASSIYADNLKRINQVPIEGTYITGQLLFRRAISDGQPLIHLCTKFGTATSLNATVTTSGNRILTAVSEIDQFNVGDFVKLQNATSTQYVIERIYADTNEIWLNTSTGIVAGENLLLTNDPPEFKSTGNININFSGQPSPEGIIAAPVGSTYQQLSNNNSPFWIKVTGTGNTGWVEVLLARSGTLTERPTNPNAGTMYFNASDKQPEWWTGTEWIKSIPNATTSKAGLVKLAEPLTTPAPALNGATIDQVAKRLAELEEKLRIAGILAG